MNKDTIRRLVRESHLDVYGLGTDRERWEATVQYFVALVEAELKKAEPVAWLYDFVVDGAVVKDWTTIDKATAYSAADGCHNQRPLYLHPPSPIPNPDLTIDKICPEDGELERLWDERIDKEIDKMEKIFGDDAK